MKLTIKLNKIKNIKKLIDGVEIEFDTEQYKTFNNFVELWLENGEKLEDYKSFKVSKTNKMTNFSK